MTKKNLKKHYYFLHALANAHPQQRKALLRTAKNSQIESICEICLNILGGNIPVNLRKMKKYKNILRNLAKKSSNIQQKRKTLVNQSGGFLPLLAPAIISTLGGILGRVIGKRL